MKKALLVGINTYDSAPLNGCVNDVLLLYKILTEKYGFRPEDTDILTDREATKVNVVNSMKKLVKGSNPGDTLFFHFSGHGSQVAVNDWTTSTETDGRDEIICTVDLDWNNPLRDDDLNRIFKIIPNGVNTLAILDCCHSGTGLRNHDMEDGVKNRFMPPPPSNILSNPKISIDDDLNFLVPVMDKSSIQTMKRRFMVNTSDQGNTILISGCQDNQTSADARFGARYHGALSYYLAESLAESQYKITYNDLITVINQKMRTRRFSQTPQLEGRATLFGNMFLQ